jgi:hypothetical protein
VLDDALLSDWCLRYLGAPFGRVLFRSGFPSEVVGVELPGGRRAVVKARPFQPRIAGCLQVQAALARADFPCPEPLTAATRVHGMTVTAETEVPSGSPLPAEAGAAPFAALLARLIGSAPAPAAVPGLAPSPPWTGWDHPGRGLWPDLDEHGQDLNLASGPEWVDDAARRFAGANGGNPAGNGRDRVAFAEWTGLPGWRTTVGVTTVTALAHPESVLAAYPHAIFYRFSDGHLRLLIDFHVGIWVQWVPGTSPRQYLVTIETFAPTALKMMGVHQTAATVTTITPIGPGIRAGMRG